MTVPGSRGIDVNPVLDGAVEVCGREALAEFSRALFAAWLEAGLPGRSGFVLSMLGRFGDEETVRLLAPHIRRWPGESGGYGRAVHGLGVLAEIGGDVALTHISGIARKSKHKGLRAEAERRLEAVAKRERLTPDQLADRLVPRFGLDSAGTLTLDYGPRRFVVGFDEQLRPTVADENGRPRTSLPKPGAKDDPDLAPAAHKRFAELKKDVRAVASGEVARLESSMVMGRAWTRAEFAEFLVGHPLMWHLARPAGLAERRPGLPHRGGPHVRRPRRRRGRASGSGDGPDRPSAAAGRLARRVVGAVRRLRDPAAVPAARPPVRTLADGEGADGRLERFEGLTVPTGKILGLTRMGWRRGAPQDGGVEHWISWTLDPKVTVVVELSPGVAAGSVDLFPEQKIARVRAAGRPGSTIRPARPRTASPTWTRSSSPSCSPTWRT
ncbi:DUF4132 domain-containing protein [Actinomadura madurae]|uniref:DUF4132 domain-containing protein n=1 Tax=Actinomadura madurae TaxID=1993 RepID=UPI0020D25127|nr:DUF4132 domain-containing protein [Actinomadura madurae]MCP9965340.1 DUF4132 domain-containing protein [Actinomadura madurae]